MTEQGIAEVIQSMGKYHLKVNGVIVATEGDVCRDWRIRKTVWDQDALEQAAIAINSGERR